MATSKLADALKQLQVIADKFGFGAYWRKMIVTDCGRNETKQAAEAARIAMQTHISADNGRFDDDYSAYISDASKLRCAWQAAQYVADNKAASIKIANYASSRTTLAEEETRELLDQIWRDDFLASGGEDCYG